MGEVISMVARRRAPGAAAAVPCSSCANHIRLCGVSSCLHPDVVRAFAPRTPVTAQERNVRFASISPCGPYGRLFAPRGPSLLARLVGSFRRLRHG